MKRLYYKWVRRCGRWSDFFLLAALLAYILTSLGALLGFLTLELPGSSGLAQNALNLIQSPNALLQGDGTDSISFLIMYLEFYGIWVVLIAVVLIFRRNRPMMRCLGKRTGGKIFLTAAIGLGLGFGMNALCVFISWLSGDIHLSFNEFRPVLFLAFLFAVIVQSGAEELAMRWYLYQKLRRRYRYPAFAIIINSALFSIMHILNPGITIVSVIQIAIVGVFLSLLIHYYDGFWMAVLFHAGWNFTQNIIFGLPNSGIVSQFSVFRLEAASARNGLFYNTGFGVEGSIGATIVLAIGCAVMIIINRGKHEKRDLWAAMEQAVPVKAK